MFNLQRKLASLFLICMFFLSNITVANAQNSEITAVNTAMKASSSQNTVDVNCQCPCQMPCQTTCQVPFQASCCDEYKVEHLPTYKGSSVNMVKLTNNSATIVANNVLKIVFTGNFSSKTICENDKVSFMLPCGLTTVEGRNLLPAGTQIIGRIQCVQKPKWFNRNAKVYLVFEQMVLPNCVTIPMCAKVYGKDCALKRSSWAAVGKAAAYTVGLFGIGTGLGAAIGAASNAAGRGALVFGMPIGGGVGLIVGTVTPGLQYKAKCGNPIYIQLAQDLVLCYN